MPNYFTSVLAAKMGVAQGPSIVNADRIGTKTDSAVLTVWGKILRLIQGKGNQLFFQQQLELLLRQIGTTARATLRAGLIDHAQRVDQNTRQILSRTIPPAHLALLAQVRSRTMTERRATEEERRQMEAIIFPRQTLERAAQIVTSTTKGVNWENRLTQQTALADPQDLAALIVGWRASGQSPRQLQAHMMPYVQGVRSTAQRVARTEAQRVAMVTRMDSYAGLGDLVIGYQVLATMDSHTRPHHAARNGQVYYKNPKPGQLGLDKMPHPPQEEDGTVAHNCRCYLIPVMDVIPHVENDPAAKALFSNPVEGYIPDPSSYSDWFRGATEPERRAVVGAGRYNAMQSLLGDGAPLTWEHFLNPKTGQLLAKDTLMRESPRARAARLAHARDVIDHRRILADAVSRSGYIPPKEESEAFNIGSYAGTLAASVLPITAIVGELANPVSKVFASPGSPPPAAQPPATRAEVADHAARIARGSFTEADLTDFVAKAKTLPAEDIAAIGKELGIALGNRVGRTKLAEKLSAQLSKAVSEETKVIREARAMGLPRKDLEYLADEIHGEAVSLWRAQERAAIDFRASFPKGAIPRRSDRRWANGEIDHSMIPGFDERARSYARENPELFSGLDFEDMDLRDAKKISAHMFEVLTYQPVGKPKRVEAMKQALRRIEESGWAPEPKRKAPEPWDEVPF